MNMNKKRPQPAAGRPRVRRGNVDDASRLRADLLDAALALFTQGGLDAVTMRSVAARVGVATMTPYRYFADKAVLLREIWLHVLGEAFDAMRVAGARHRDIKARIRAELGALFDYWEGHPEQFRLVFMTEQTAGLLDAAGPAPGNVYSAILEHALDEARSLAVAIGGDPALAKLASDMRALMGMGYLHARIVNRQYPWSAPRVLRTACIDNILAAMERCLTRAAPRARA
jgi:AcrR family transcriptional regulator